MNKKRKLAVWLFAAASVFSFIAALIPVFKGEGPNGFFLAAGALWLTLAIATAKGARGGGKNPSAG